MNQTRVLDRPRTLVLNSADNVAVALSNLDVGTMTPQGIKTTKRVPKGHKFAIVLIARGQPVVKFGQIIGFASKPIAPGEWQSGAMPIRAARWQG